MRRVSGQVPPRTPLFFLAYVLVSRRQACATVQSYGKNFGDVYPWPMPLGVTAAGDLLASGTFGAGTLDLGIGLGALGGGASFFLADMGP